MSKEKSIIYEELKVIYKLFPGAEVLKKDGSWEKLSCIFEFAADENERKANLSHHKLKAGLNLRQRTLDFGPSKQGNIGGGE